MHPFHQLWQPPALQYKEYGYIPAALPDSRCFGEGSLVTARKVSTERSGSLLQQRGGSAPALAFRPRLGGSNVLGSLAETQPPGATSAGGCFGLHHGLGSQTADFLCIMGYCSAIAPAGRVMLGVLALSDCSAHWVLPGTELLSGNMPEPRHCETNVAGAFLKCMTACVRCWPSI